jgi:hypothetical protein
MAKTIITEKSFRDAYKKFQRESKNIGTDEQFAAYLNKNYKTQTGKLFSTGNVLSLRTKLEIQSPVASGTNPTDRAKFIRDTTYSTKEIDKANKRLKYVSNADIRDKVVNKFKDRPANFPNFKTAYYPYLEELDTIPKKIDKSLKSMLADPQPLKKPLIKELVRLTGLDETTIKKPRLGNQSNLEKSETYQKNKKNLDILKKTREFPPDYYQLPFKKQLEYATKLDEGMPRYTGMGGEVKYSTKTQNKIMEFAIRSWNNKRGALEGPIQFFKKGSDKPIKWERGVKLPFNKVEFSYEGNRHSFKKLISPVYKDTYFKEIFDKQKALNNLNAQKIENPFNKREKISVRDLNKKIQSSKKGYGYSANKGSLDLFHGKRGVGDRPFTDLTYGASDINRMEEVFRKSTVSKNPTIAKSEFNKMRKILNRSVLDPKTGKKLTGDKLNQSIIDRSNYQAEAMKNNKFKGYEELKTMVMEEAKNPNSAVCRRIGSFRKDGGRMGFASGSGCTIEVNNAIDNDPVKFAQDMNKTEGMLPKIQNAASKFLSVAKKGGRFGAFAAAGAAAAGLVKEFRNDDPSTYLSNENQQKNMLIDMLTQPVSTPLEQPSTAFGDAQLPAIGAVTAAGMVPGGAELYRQRTGAGSMKRPLGGPRLDAEGAKILKNRVSPFRAALGPLSGVLGKGLAATGTPLGMLALEPLYIGQQIADGDSAGEIATNPLNYLGPAFAGSLTKESTRFVPKTISSIMRLGISPTALKTVSRRFGLPGLGISAGISAYEMYQNKKAGRGLFDDG